MKNFHSVGHRVDPLSAPALGGAGPAPLSCRLPSPALAWTVTVAWPFPRVSRFSHIAACTIILRCRTGHVRCLVNATGYSCTWLREGYRVHVLQRRLGHTFQGSKSTRPLPVSSAVLSHVWDGARPRLVIEACAQQQPKPRSIPMSVSGNVAEQRSHLSSETISITANNAEPVLFHACWGRSSVGTAPRAPHLCAPVTSSDVPPALASASCSGHQLFPCPPRTPCPGGWNCGFFRRGAVRTQLPASRGGPARRPDLLPGFPRGGGGRDRGLGAGGHHMTSVRGRALGGGAQHDHGQRCRARC